MATRIRLRRAGRRHLPFYHIAVYDIRQRRDADYIERIGHYDPTNSEEAAQVVLDKERAAYWLGTGAQPSQTVLGIMKKQGVEVPEKKAAPKREVKARAKAAGVKERTKKRTANSKARKAKKKE